MASAFSHAVAALGIGSLFYRPNVPKRVWVAGMVCAALPDIDSVGFRMGIHYGDFLGHRGFTHSLVFAGLLSAAACLAFGHKIPTFGRSRLWCYLFLATFSHGLLDAMTNGGLGVAFFSPFDDARYFLPWRPILVAPISIRRFFSGRGIEVIQNEMFWIWIPSAIAGAAVCFLGCRRTAAEKVTIPVQSAE